MKKLVCFFIFIFPVLTYGQRKGQVCGNIIQHQREAISDRQKIVPDTVVNGSTIWVYPYFYRDEDYLVLSDKMCNGSYRAYYSDTVSLAFTVTYKNRKAEGIIYSYYKNGNIRAVRTNHKGNL